MEARLDWFRFYNDTLENEKVQDLAPELYKAWVNLLCIARRFDGFLPALPKIAFQLHTTPETARAWVNALIDRRLFDQTADGVRPHDWDEYQYDSDSSTSRVHKHRIKQKEERNVSETFLKRARADTDTENTISRRRRFIDSPKKEKQKTDDDDKKAWASEKDELAALVLQSTGANADRKLLDSIEGEIEGRGQTLWRFLDDIRPRLKRLKGNPGPGFFLSHARSFGGFSQDLIKPVEVQVPCCKWGTRSDGQPCPDCETGRELQRAGERNAADKAKASEVIQ